MVRFIPLASRTPSRHSYRTRSSRDRRMLAGTSRRAPLRPAAMLSLADERARDPHIAGAKAAALAQARAAGLPVLPGTVVTVGGAARFLLDDPGVTKELRQV